MTRYAPSDMLTALGQTKTINQWAAELGCPVQTILGRLHRNKDPDTAVSEPVRPSKSKGKTLPPETLTIDEMRKLLGVCNDGATGCRNRALIAVGWRAGIRISEAIALCPKDIDRGSGSIRILHGKGDKAGTVGIDAEAITLIDGWVKTRDSLGLAADATLFCTLEGGRLSDRYVRNLMTRLGKSAGIAKRVHYHGLRHTMAGELAAEGVSMDVIQAQLRHSNLQITSRYIARINPANLVARMSKRTWNREGNNANGVVTSPIAAPDWLDQLRADIRELITVLQVAQHKIFA